MTGRGAPSAPAAVAYPYLLLPSLWSSQNRARRREKGDFTRAVLFGGVALLVAGALFAGSFWLTLQLVDYAELGDYLLRLGLSWLFLTFLSFLAFSGVVASLSTFFLSDDLRLLLAAPVSSRRLFHARFARTVAQSSWMVVVFIVPVLGGVALARCAPAGFVACYSANRNRRSREAAEIRRCCVPTAHTGRRSDPRIH